MDSENTKSDHSKSIHDVRRYGAKGDGETNDTVAIQAAVDACAGTGGTVLLSNGFFLSGQVELKDQMTFYIDENAVLLGINGTSYKEAISHYPVEIPDYETRTTSSIVSWKGSMLPVTSKTYISKTVFWNGLLS